MSICDVCTKANVSCPVWYPGKYTIKCVEFDQTKLELVVNKPIEETIQERGSTHGDVRAQMTLAHVLKLAIRGQVATLSVEDMRAMDEIEHLFGDTDPVARECIDMILFKVSRIIAGLETFDDHWHDVEGYAKIAKEQVCKNHKQ